MHVDPRTSSSGEDIKIEGKTKELKKQKVDPKQTQRIGALASTIFFTLLSITFTVAGFATGNPILVTLGVASGAAAVISFLFMMEYPDSSDPNGNLYLVVLNHRVKFTFGRTLFMAVRPSAWPTRFSGWTTQTRHWFPTRNEATFGGHSVPGSGRGRKGGGNYTHPTNFGSQTKTTTGFSGQTFSHSVPGSGGGRNFGGNCGPKYTPPTNVGRGGGTGFHSMPGRRKG